MALKGYGDPLNACNSGVRKANDRFQIRHKQDFHWQTTESVLSVRVKVSEQSWSRTTERENIQNNV
jgi:hypothetical protein